MGIKRKRPLGAPLSELPALEARCAWLLPMRRAALSGPASQRADAAFLLLHPFDLLAAEAASPGEAASASNAATTAKSAFASAETSEAPVAGKSAVESALLTAGAHNTAANPFAPHFPLTLDDFLAANLKSCQGDVRVALTLPAAASVSVADTATSSVHAHAAAVAAAAGAAASSSAGAVSVAPVTAGAAASSPAVLDGAASQGWAVAADFRTKTTSAAAAAVSAAGALLPPPPVAVELHCTGPLYSGPNSLCRQPQRQGQQRQE